MDDSNTRLSSDSKSRFLCIGRRRDACPLRKANMRSVWNIDAVSQVGRVNDFAKRDRSSALSLFSTSV